MSKYEKGDIVTYYFIVLKIDNKPGIVGWSDDKDLIKSYMEFHKCKDYHLKEVTDTIDNIGKILEENIHDEIRLMNILIKDPTKKHRDKMKYILVPCTDLQADFITSEQSCFLSARINYGFINSAFYYLKGKYRKALEDIFLMDVIDTVVNNRSNKITRNMKFDQLLILTRNFPEHFGL